MEGIMRQAILIGGIALLSAVAVAGWVRKPSVPAPYEAQMAPVYQTPAYQPAPAYQAQAYRPLDAYGNYAPASVPAPYEAQMAPVYQTPAYQPAPAYQAQVYPAQ